MSFHAGQTFTFGEQPSATKWQYLWDNDYALADGTGISDDAIIARHLADDSVGSAQLYGIDKSNLTTDSNPYKFSAYRNAALTDGSGTYVLLPYDTEQFDTNNNFDVTTNKGRYTIPVDGYYHLSWFVNKAVTAGSAGLSYLYKNGAAFWKGSESIQGGSGSNGLSSVGSAFFYATAGEYYEVYTYGSGGTVQTGAQVNRFSGYLVCRS